MSVSFFKGDDLHHSAKPLETECWIFCRMAAKSYPAWRVMQPKDRATVAQAGYSRPARSNRSIHRVREDDEHSPGLSWQANQSETQCKKKASTRLAKVILEAM
ncbi:hypothetical protein LAN87_001264 [Salmonella enterica]|nr:hypothetical protein [Salmonella enterica]HCM1830304.1 hypothetical protein [Salmonella enterica subsp. salamae serovar 48:z81:z39]EHX3571262.1 hypothetical protein [Salmonella enterica]EIB6272669.1 hypothetical protein [Salmonella enterica]EIC8060547.1 hypothetical protein [Salmonella enterica]